MRILTTVGLLAALVAIEVHATSVTHEFTHIGGDTWQASYVLANDTLPDSIGEITIWYELGTYENIVALDAPGEWDPVAIQPEPGIPDDGFYDALALSDELAPGASIGEFHVQFDLIGAVTPQSQFFEVFSGSFVNLDSGFTQPAVSNVPLPLSVPLFVSSLAILARRRANRSSI